MEFVTTLRRVAIGISAAGLMFAAGMVIDRIIVYPAQAEQFGVCFVYMITNPDVHKSACGPQAAGDVTQPAASG